MIEAGFIRLLLPGYLCLNRFCVFSSKLGPKSDSDKLIYLTFMGVFWVSIPIWLNKPDCEQPSNKYSPSTGARRSCMYSWCQKLQPVGRPVFYRFNIFIVSDKYLGI